MDGFGSEVLTSEVCFLLDAFLPGSYFLLLIARWSFFSATAKSLATCNCVHLELKSFFDVAAAWRRCWMVVTFAGSLLGSMEN